MADEGFKRKLAAILSADVIGYSRLMRNDEEATVRDIAAHRVLISDIVKKHHGRVVDSPGDNILAEFASVVDAVNGAIKIQGVIKSRNKNTPKDRRMEFRIGINLGDVIEEEERIYGDGVNIASRVEGLASAGGIAISGTVYEHIKEKLSLGYHYLGEQEVKNISEPVRVYRLLTEPANAGKIIGGEKPRANKLLWAAATAIVLIILSVCTITIRNYYFRPSFEPASVEKMAFPLPEKPSIAVLPFDNMSGDPEQEYFSDGFTEYIIASLSMLPEVFVIARNSTFTYKNKPVKVQKVAEDLGVQYVLEGSIQKEEQKVRITAQLIDAVTGRHVWAEKYDRELKDIFTLQDEITIRLITELRVKLTEGEQARVLTKGTKNLQAYLKYLQAKEFFRKQTKEDNAIARRLLNEVIIIDTKFPQAYTYLGATYWMDIYYPSNKSPKESLKKAIELNKQAISLNESIPISHSQIGWLYSLTGKHDSAIAECERAISLDPNSADAHLWMGYALRYAGRHDEAVRSTEKALRLNPIPPSTYFRSLGLTYIFVGRYKEAIAAFNKSLNQSPNDPLSHFSLACVYSLVDQNENAKAEAQKVLELNPKFSLNQFARRLSYKNQADKDLIIGAARKAGLPDEPPLPLPDKPSIAILAFDNMSGNPKQEYFSDGVAENIITALSKVGELFVIARNSSFTYKGKPVNVKQVARELGVRYVLEGSVRKSEDRVRITAQLIDATSGHHMWSEKYDRDMKDLFALQDEITLEIIRAMRVQLTEGEQASVTGRGTENLDAYLKANQAHEQFYLMNKKGSMKAKELAKEAIALDPNYAFPYATLANAHMLDVWFKFSASSEESMKLAAQAVKKARSLDASDPRVYHALTNLYIMQRQYEKAIASAEQRLELSPSGADAHFSMGLALSFAGRDSEAIPFFKQAVRLDPYPPSVTYRQLADSYRKVGRNEEAITEYKKALQLNPDDIFTHLDLAALYIKLGREEEARAEAKEVIRIHPKFSLDHYAKSIHDEKDQSGVAAYIEGLRKAGLPD